jgi:pterin-4a-carbinolamine dehydratase/uncharacterized damage-inducible protein DinB
MDGTITADEFRASDGVDDWRVVRGAACALFRTGSFTAGVELVDAVGELAEAAGHHPDVDLRYGSVLVRLVSHDVGGLSARDVALARQVSAAARELDVPADPAALTATPGSADPERDEQGRPEPPLDGDEAATLLGYLEFQRATLAWKTDGLDAAGLAATIHPTTMTLGGLLKHLAYVEDDWAVRTLHDRPRPEPWASVDWAADPDWDWHSAADDSPEQLHAQWRASVERSRAAISEALDAGGLGFRCRRAWPDGRAPSLRWVLTHLVEEYARHNGHADLLREAVDGRTGE